MTNFRLNWNLAYRATNQLGEPCAHVMAFYRLKLAGKK